jgi:hypothetical protein
LDDDHDNAEENGDGQGRNLAERVGSHPVKPSDDERIPRNRTARAVPMPDQLPDAQTTMTGALDDFDDSPLQGGPADASS